MRITSFTDYTLRVLYYLAMLPDDRLATIREIAVHFGISHNHLTKVVHQLSCRGYIASSRGKNGGIKLLKKPQDINIGKVVRETELDMDLVECFSEEHNTCDIAPVCGLKGIFAEALSSFLATLDTYTLADAQPPQGGVIPLPQPTRRITDKSPPA